MVVERVAVSRLLKICVEICKIYVHCRKNTKVMSRLQTSVEILKCESRKLLVVLKKKRTSREIDNADQLNSCKKRRP